MESLDPIFSPTGKVIDLELGQNIMSGDIEAAQEMLVLLVQNLQKEIHTLEAAKQNQNWAQIKTITHKIHGGSLYCGTPRLQQIAHYLDRYLSHQNTPLKNQLLDLFMEEIKQVCLVHQALKANLE